jgi:hypothetical protein
MQKVRSSSWEEVSCRMSLVTDALGKPIDEGIFDTVVALNILGFQTTMSCEGHRERGIAAPWVDIEPLGIQELRTQITAKQKEVNTEESGPKKLSKEALLLHAQLKAKQLALFQSLTKLLDQFYIYPRGYIAYNQRLIPRLWGIPAGRIRLEPMGTELQTIVPPQEKEEKLKEYQQEMNDFTTFLRLRIE